MLTKRQKWDSIIARAESKGFLYEVKALYRGDGLWPRSHYPALFSPELLIPLYGEGPMSDTNPYPLWRYHAHMILDKALDYGDTVDYLYQTAILGGTNEHNTSGVLGEHGTYDEEPKVFPE